MELLLNEAAAAQESAVNEGVRAYLAVARQQKRRKGRSAAFLG